MPYHCCLQILYPSIFILASFHCAVITVDPFISRFMLSFLRYLSLLDIKALKIHLYLLTKKDPNSTPTELSPHINIPCTTRGHTHRELSVYSLQKKIHTVQALYTNTNKLTYCLLSVVAVQCGPAPIPQFGMVIFEKKFRGNSSLYGLQVTYKCLPPYALIGDARAACTANGTWTKTPECRGMKPRKAGGSVVFIVT